MRGQYRGYRDVVGVAPDSTTETYAALRLEIDNWRWSGVPSSCAPASALPEKVTEVRLVFQRAPTLHFARHKNRLAPNQLVLRIDPDGGLNDSARPQGLGSGVREIHPDMDFAQEGGLDRLRTRSFCPRRWTGIGRTSPGRTPWEQTGASSSRCWTTRRRCRSTSPAVSLARPRRCPDTGADGTNPGCNPRPVLVAPTTRVERSVDAGEDARWVGGRLLSGPSRTHGAWIQDSVTGRQSGGPQA